MSSAISLAFPQDLQGYAKGGNIDWGDFHCLCFAGQMITGRAQISFCFTLNWTAPAARTPDIVRRYRTAVVAALLAAARGLMPTLCGTARQISRLSGH